MASLLEAFFFSFSADTRQVREGIDSGRRGAEQLNQSLLHTDEVAGRLGSSFLDLAKSAGALVAGTLALSSIKAMTIASAEQTNELAKQAREYRTNANELLAWQNAATSAGGSAEGFNATLKMLTERFRDPQKGLEALTRAADRFKGLDDFQADRLGARLGLDAGTIAIMRQGSAGVQDMIIRQKELSSITKEDTDTARKFRQQLQDTNTVYDDIRRKVATQVLPILTDFLKFMERITIWTRDNKWFVLSFFGGVAAIITAIYLPAIISATVATFALIAPYLLIGAAIAAVAGLFALAYDDVMNFLAGNKSLLGEMEKRYPIVGDIVRGLIGAFTDLWSGVKIVVQGIIDLFTKGPQAAFDNFVISATAMLDRLADRFPQFANIFNLIAKAISMSADFGMRAWDKFFSALKVWFDWLWGALKFTAGVIGTVAEWLGKAAGWLGKAANDTAGFVLDATGNAPAPAGVTNGPTQVSTSALIAAGRQQVQSAAAAPTNSQTTNSIMNSRTSTTQKTMQVTIPQVTINTQATSADDIAKGFNQSLSEQLRNAHSQFDDGVES